LRHEHNETKSVCSHWLSSQFITPVKTGVGSYFPEESKVDFSRGSKNDFFRGHWKWWNL